jgi:hypothetical protein
MMGEYSIGADEAINLLILMGEKSFFTHEKELMGKK